MFIRIERIGFDDFQIELFHMLRAFYEKVEITVEQEADADVDSETDADANVAVAIDATLILELITTTNDTRKIKGTFLFGDKKNTRTVNVSASPVGEQEAERRMLKRAVLICVLELLREATGLEQPWGVLTGVRPTKLMHNLIAEHGRLRAEKLLREEYLVMPHKVELLSEVAERQLRVLPDLFRLDREVSIYIGIPFCPTKCAYCTFPAYDIRGNDGSVDDFLVGLEEEIRSIGRWLSERKLGITTIYWGGGTPTSISAEQMDTLFRAMQESFPHMDRVRELTVEAGRPDTITPDKIEVMKRWHVDRISINPQSFTQATLDAIGRHHTVEETVEKFKLARQMGMNNINMDLIIGLPGEGMDTYEKTLRETEQLLPESLTVHTLSFKRASKMTKDREQYEVADRQEIERMVQMTNEWTAEHGYKPYYLYRQKNILGNLENVGYSLEGRESLYNIIMMEERQSVIGLGCGAVSKIVWPGSGAEPDDNARRIERMPNPKEPAAYNHNYREYIAKKIEILEEAYGKEAVKAL